MDTMTPTNDDLFGDEPPPSPRPERTKLLAVAGAVVIAVLAIGGIALARSNASSSTTSGTAPGGPGGQGGQAGPGGPPGGQRPTARGMVTGVDATTITITDDSGQTITITTSGDTTFETFGTSGPQSASRSDVTVGQQIGVLGTTASDGTVSATRVMVGTPQGAPNGQGGPPGGGAPSGVSP